MGRGKWEKESLNGKREVGNLRVHVKGKSEANRETEEEQEGREEERKETGKEGKKNTEERKRKRGGKKNINI